jgi:hypothetical protein
MAFGQATGTKATPPSVRMSADTACQSVRHGDHCGLGKGLVTFYGVLMPPARLSVFIDLR